MIFVDTNIFLRFFLKDVKNQYQEAEDLFLKSADGKVELISSTIVLFELKWVLGSYYRLSKDQVISVLYKVLLLKIEFDERDIIQRMLDLYSTSNLSLEDCYNLIFTQDRQVKEFKTFDKKLLKVFKTKSLSSPTTI